MITLRPFITRDATACTGCRLCELACHARENASAATVGCLQGPVLPRMRAGKNGLAFTLVFCAQCEDPPCAKACPERAITTEPGRVVVDPALCKGCPDCQSACPLQAIRIVRIDAENRPEKTLPQAWKCDLCTKRIEGPACVEACPVGALAHMEPRRDRKRKNVATALALCQPSRWDDKFRKN